MVTGVRATCISINRTACGTQRPTSPIMERISSRNPGGELSALGSKGKVNMPG